MTEAYTEALLQHIGDIPNATLEQLRVLTPHLDPDLVQQKFLEVLNSDDEYASWYFYIPGVRVQGVVWSASLRKDREGLLRISGGYTAHEVGGHGSILNRTGVEEARAWQKANLDFDSLLNPYTEPDEQGITRPRWSAWYEGVIRDASQRVRDDKWVTVEKGMQDGRPRTVFTVALVYKAGLDPNTTQKGHVIEATEANTDMIISSRDRLLWGEVGGCNRHRYGPMHNWCALCGRSMHMTGCSSCGYRYRDNQYDCGGGIPMPPSVEKLMVEAGLTPPPTAEAVRQEYMDYQAEQKREWERKYGSRA